MVYLYHYNVMQYIVIWCRLVQYDKEKIWDGQLSSVGSCFVLCSCHAWAAEKKVCNARCERRRKITRYTSWRESSQQTNPSKFRNQILVGKLLMRSIRFTCVLREKRTEIENESNSSAPSESNQDTTKSASTERNPGEKNAPAKKRSDRGDCIHCQTSCL